MRCVIQPRFLLSGTCRAGARTVAMASAPAGAANPSRRYPYPPPIVVPSSRKQSATVIWMHGLGDTGNGWSGITGQLQLPWVKVRTRPLTVLPLIYRSAR